METLVVHHGIAAAAHTVEFQLNLVGHKSLGVVLYRNQIVYKVLANPFLGSKRNPPAPQGVEYLRAVFAIAYFYIELR